MTSILYFEPGNPYVVPARRTRIIRKLQYCCTWVPIYASQSHIARSIKGYLSRRSAWYDTALLAHI